jgi:hypothetical protein
VNQGRRPFSPDEREHLVRLYDGNLAYVDQEVGAFRRALEEQGLWDRTVFIVAADHGEGLLEHGWIGHNVELFEPSAHVPLIVRFPAGVGPRGQRAGGLVDLLDLAPTIADVFGARAKGGADRQFKGAEPPSGGARGPGQAARCSRGPCGTGRGTRSATAASPTSTKTATAGRCCSTLRLTPARPGTLATTERLRAAYYRETLHEWTRSVFKGVRSGSESVETMSKGSSART